MTRRAGHDLHDGVAFVTRCGYNPPRMKLNARNSPQLIRLLLLCMVIGTLAWEITERIVAAAGGSIDLSVGPVGFDIEVIALWVTANPGTLVGIVPAILLFRRM